MVWQPERALRVAEGEYFATNLFLMDTERENEIGLGPEYPYDALGEGECIVSSDYEEDYGLNEYMTLQIDIN